MSQTGDNLSTDERIRQIHHAIAGDPQYGTEGLLQKLDRLSGKMTEHEQEDRERFKAVFDRQQKIDEDREGDDKRISDLESRLKSFLYLGALIVFFGVVIGIVNGYYQLPFVKDRDDDKIEMQKTEE